MFLKISFEVIKAPEKIIVKGDIRRKMKDDIAIEQDWENTNQNGEILKPGKESKNSGHTNLQFVETTCIASLLKGHLFRKT
jgi:hypothetical protein